MQEALESELRASGTDAGRREALLALLADADTAAASTAASMSLQQQHQQEQETVPLQPPPPMLHSPPPFSPPPPPFPQEAVPQGDDREEGASKKSVGFHSYGANKANQHGRQSKKQQQKGIAAWVKGREEKQARADRELAVRKQPGSEQVSSGFPDMAPIAKARCNIPFDISGAARGGNAGGGEAPSGGQGPPPLSVDMVRRAAQVVNNQPLPPLPSPPQSRLAPRFRVH